MLGAPGNLVGLREIPSLLQGIITRVPLGRDRASLERIRAFAGFAATNLDASRSVLETVGQPIAVKNTLIQGRRTPLDTFAVVVA